MSGLRRVELPREVLTMADDTGVDSKRWLLLKGKVGSGSKASVSRLAKQGSHMITTLPRTDHLIVVPAGQRGVRKGSKVTTYRLPYSEED